MFPLTVVMLVATSLTPTRWLGLVNDLSAIVRIPLAPLGDAGNQMAAWLRPTSEPHIDLSTRAQEVIAELERDKRVSEQLYLAELQRSNDLEEQIRQLQLVPNDQRAPVMRLNARITARDPEHLFGDVQLNHGENSAVRSDAVGVYSGSFLLGRVTEVRASSSSLRPVASVSTGLIQALVYPVDREGSNNGSVQRVLLAPQEDRGFFLADIDRNFDVGVGDIVRLSDPGWPSFAQQMIVGEVASVEPKDRQPLRNVITVKPRYQLYDLAYVTLVMEVDTDRGVGWSEGGAP